MILKDVRRNHNIQATKNWMTQGWNHSESIAESSYCEEFRITIKKFRFEKLGVPDFSSNMQLICKFERLKKFSDSTDLNWKVDDQTIWDLAHKAEKNVDRRNYHSVIEIIGNCNDTMKEVNYLYKRVLSSHDS